MSKKKPKTGEKMNKKFVKLVKKHNLDRAKPVKDFVRIEMIRRAAYFRFAKAIAKAHKTFGWKFEMWPEKSPEGKTLPYGGGVSIHTPDRTIFQELDFIDSGDGLVALSRAFRGNAPKTTPPPGVVELATKADMDDSLSYRGHATPKALIDQQRRNQGD